MRAVASILFAASLALGLSLAAPASAEREIVPGAVKTVAAPKPLSKAERAKLSKTERAKLEKLEAQQAKADKAKSEKERLAAERREAKQKLQPVAAVAAIAPAAPVTDVVVAGNNGELRSEGNERPVGLFAGLFGGEIGSRMLPQTRALDAVLETRNRKSTFKVKSDFEPQTVAFPGYQRGTIVVSTSDRYLYLIESPTSARRYAIAVGREGLEFKGTAKVGDKQEWPRWIPTIDMQKREPKKYGQYKDGMPGGPDNPLGARAIYLYQGKKDTHIRIHGTNQPQSIGTNSSNGCFRMVNEHVMDLYGRVKVGTEVIVL